MGYPPWGSSPVHLRYHGSGSEVEQLRSNPLSAPPDKPGRPTRREIVRNLALSPILFRAAGFSVLTSSVRAQAQTAPPPALPFREARYKPQYPSRSPLEDVLRLVPPGSDDYVEEKYASEIAAILERWAKSLQSGELSVLSNTLDPAMRGSSLNPLSETRIRAEGIVESRRRVFPQALTLTKQAFLATFNEWLGRETRVARASFEITAIHQIASQPLTVRLQIRYDLAAETPQAHREQRIGTWLMDWSRESSELWKVLSWQAESETLSTAKSPVFTDITEHALGKAASYRDQMLHGSDHWRTALDGACGIDVYGNNGIAAGDFDNDGFDDLYISQPAGLPNRLYRNHGDGTFEDVTDRAGVGVLDNTSCALFADLRNIGLQDLLVVCGSGPLLFLNQGNGTFQLKPDAFRFARTPQGTFTHAAISDYDRDGRLDIFFCLYSYYLGLDQYHYPVPYFDARNGPPNFLLHNNGDGTFTDRTTQAGLNVDNDRYSFACAWGEASSSGAPDLYVVNDFGRNNLYRNNGDGTFTAASTASHVEDVGAGMSAAWADFNNDGRPDLYVANMWSAAGKRVSTQKRFHERSTESIRALYRRHAEGNGLYRNDGAGIFHNAGEQAGVDVGRWAWCSDLWDFDHDGYLDLYVTNGYISAPEPPSSGANPDLGSFFWRQVVGNSPDDSTPSLAYEHGWNAINELIRSDSTWSGFERNVMFANNRDGTFSDVSGVTGIDFLEDGRSFALADLNHDGRLEVFVKNRNAPQLRILQNTMAEIGDSIAFRLRGTKSNRDAIGTAITVTIGDHRQTRHLQAGSGFLAQHTKEVFFGLGKSAEPVNASIRWPSGVNQRFDALPRNRRIHLEEGRATFDATPFSSPTPLRVSSPDQPLPQKPRDASVETWLLHPLRAPLFALPDLSGTTQRLEDTRGSATLLVFWSSDPPLSQSLLQSLQQSLPVLKSSKIKLLAINLDPPEEIAKGRGLTGSQSLSFPTLFATPEVAGIYNIVYRYLFDRRRDLPLPTTFLLNSEGMIVKLYQGALVPAHVVDDARSIPATPADRIRRALPFLGHLYQATFLRNDYTYGVAMFQHGYLDQAEDSFRQVVAARPNDPEGFYNLGTLKLRKNDFAQARIYLQQTIKLRPDYPEAWNNLGMMSAQEGHAEDAIRNFEQSLKLRPTYATALLNLGNVYRRQGDASKAQEALNRALNLQPDDPEANYSLGMFYAQQSQLQQAVDYLRKAIALRPAYPEALNNLGVLFVRTEDYPQAEQQFETCIRLAPTFDQSYINLARLYLLQQSKTRARQALESLLHVHPESAAAKQLLQTIDTAP